MTSEPDGDAWKPAIDGMDDEQTDQDTGGQSDRLEWLMPDDSDSDNDGRTGLLSTRVEWHALVLGFSAGIVAAPGEQFDTIASVVGVGTVGSRAQMGLSDTYLKQAKRESPYFAAGFVIGYALGRFGPLLVGTGIGA